MAGIYFKILIIAFSLVYASDSGIIHVDYNFGCNSRVDKFCNYNLSDTSFLNSGEQADHTPDTAPKNKAYIRSRMGPVLTDKIVFGTKWRNQVAVKHNLSEKEIEIANIYVDAIYSFSENPDFMIVYYGIYNGEQLINTNPPIPLRYAMLYLPAIDSIFFYDDICITGFLSNEDKQASDSLNNTDLENDYNADNDNANAFRDEIPKIDSVQVYDDYSGFKEMFNYWVDNSNDLTNMDPVCLSALVLTLTSGLSRTYTLESTDDLKIALSIEEASSPVLSNAQKPNIVFSVGYLFFTDLSNVAGQCPELLFYNSEQSNDKIDRYFLDNDFVFHPPAIDTEDVNLSINITAYSSGNIGEYKISLSKGNHLISLDTLKIISYILK